jgi:FAS-associated factor 2
MLVVARTEANERETDRIMRTMQDDEYSRALAEDQAREEKEERQRAEEEERRHEAEAARKAEEEAEASEAAAESAKRAARLAKGGSLPDEPPSDAANVTRLVIRLPDGTRLDRRFEIGCALQDAIDYIESVSPDIYDFDLVQNYPRKVFTQTMRGQSFEDLGLCPAVTLFTKEQDD